MQIHWLLNNMFYIFLAFTDESRCLKLENDQNLPNTTPLKEELESIDMILAKYEEVEHGNKII